MFLIRQNALQRATPRFSVLGAVNIPILLSNWVSYIHPPIFQNHQLMVPPMFAKYTVNLKSLGLDNAFRCTDTQPLGAAMQSYSQKKPLCTASIFIIIFPPA